MDYIDLTDIKATAKGNDEFVLHLLGKLIQQIDAQIKELEQYGEKNAWEDVHKTAHALNSVVLLTGNEALVKLLTALEHQAKNEPSAAKVTPLIKQVIQLARHVVEALKEERSKLSPS